MGDILGTISSSQPMILWDAKTGMPEWRAGKSTAGKPGKNSPTGISSAATI